MTSKELYRIISKLLDGEMQAVKLEKEIQLRKSGRPAWYKSQKEHWLGWVKGYQGPGAYGRANWDRDAAFIYNHIQYAPMLLWLGEALGVPTATLKKASAAAIAAGKEYASQCAALRREIPWESVEAMMKKKKL